MDFSLPRCNLGVSLLAMLNNVCNIAIHKNIKLKCPPKKLSTVSLQSPYGDKGIIGACKHFCMGVVDTMCLLVV